MEEFTKQVIEKLKEETEINGIPLFEFVERVNENFKNKRCDFIDCRYNQDRQCVNEGVRKECVEVSLKVLCLEDRGDNE